MADTRGMLAERVGEIRERIADAARRGGRDASEVTLVAVTKTVPAEIVRTAVGLGLGDLGENRVQEALAKQAEVGRDAARWHLIGTLQTNKARRAVESFELIHSLDRLELAEALAEAGRKAGRSAPVLIQVNIAGEASKHGLSPEGLLPFLECIASMRELRPQGLMTMAPFVTDAELTRPVFSELRKLFERARREFDLGDEWRWLSMGMTQDYEVAVEEGANMVRIGTGIFGTRR